MTLLPWAIGAVLAAGIGGMFFGMDIQSDRQKAAVLVQERAMHQAYVAKVAEYRAHAQTVAKELNDETAKRQTDAVAYRAELARARTGAAQLAVCNPVGPGVRLTGDFVGLYDRALDIGRMPGPTNPARVDATAPRPDPVEPADVLAVHGENAEAWAECRSALRGWQALARRYGWVQ